jgi:hypothetical protein
MMRAADNAAIRSAIGLGQTDAPTFLAQTLTGQSLTGTQATSLVDLNAIWNTDGNPSLIYGRVTNTKSGTTANLIDLGTLAGGSLFNVNKQGRTQTGMVGSSITSNFSGILFSSTIHSHYVNDGIYLDVRVSGTTIGGPPGTGATLSADATGILAQRNGTAKQTLRIYNTYTSATVYERAVMDWNGPTPNTLRIGTEFLGSGMAANPVDFVVGGVVQLSITTGGTLVSPTSIRLRGAFTEIQGVNGAAGAHLNFIQRGRITPTADGVFKLSNDADNGFTRLELGTANLGISRGTGSPEGVVTALVGSLYLRTDGGAATTLYVKESSPTPSTGWVAK